MVYVRNSEQRLLDNFRSLNAHGQAYLSMFAQQEVFKNHSDTVDESYGNMADADNIVQMSELEQRFIANFRRCNEAGCNSIVTELNSARMHYLNSEYITSEEWLLLDLFRKCSVENRFQLIQSLMNCSNNF